MGGDRGEEVEGNRERKNIYEHTIFTAGYDGSRSTGRGRCHPFRMDHDRPEDKELERRVAEYCQVNRAVCLNSQTACAEMALRLLGIGAENGGARKMK